MKSAETESSKNSWHSWRLIALGAGALAVAVGVSGINPLDNEDNNPCKITIDYSDDVASQRIIKTPDGRHEGVLAVALVLLDTKPRVIFSADEGPGALEEVQGAGSEHTQVLEHENFGNYNLRVRIDEANQTASSICIPNTEMPHED